ncbi:MAG: hypothetical protein P8X65_02230 [Syntrophobacterales bacterium]|jgi:hypothetical protein
MKWWRFGWGLLVVIWLVGCASSGGPGHDDTLSVGQREADLVARKGQPQEVKPGPGGGKIYVYTTYSLDQVAAMGGGAWNKPDQVYYWLNDQGIITKVAHYPYGKRKFLFPSEERPPQMAQAPAPRPEVQVASASPATGAAPGPQAPPAPTPAAKSIATPAPKPTPPPAAPGPALSSRKPAKASETPSTSPARSDMEAATRLELNMTRKEVRQVLGPPERTEGFQATGRGVIVWFYSLENRLGRRVDTPLVFEEGRLRGWGENYYRRRLREISSPHP